MAYSGQHYTQANLSDGDGVSTGLVDPRTVNWLAALITVEATRFATALFGGASPVNRFHIVTRPEWPSGASTPFVTAMFRPPTESKAFNNQPEVRIRKIYGDDEDKTVSFRWPRMFDIPIAWTVYTTDEYPPFDLEQKLLNLADNGTATVVNETIVYEPDTPVYTWDETEAKAVGSQVAIVYRNVPLVWGTYIDWGSVIKKVALAVFDKPAYDDFAVDESLD